MKDKLLTDEVYEDILEGLVYVLASNTNFEETQSDMITIYYPWIFKVTEMAKLVENKVKLKFFYKKILIIKNNYLDNW